MWSGHICLREACIFDAFVLDWGQRTVCRVYKKICALGSKQAGFSKELSYWNETELIHIPHSTLWSICSHGSRFDGFQHVITCYNKSLSDPPRPFWWTSVGSAAALAVARCHGSHPSHGGEGPGASALATEVPHGDTAIGWGSGCAAGLPWFSRTGGEEKRIILGWHGWCGYNI